MIASAAPHRAVLAILAVLHRVGRLQRRPHARHRARRITCFSTCRPSLFEWVLVVYVALGRAPARRSALRDLRRALERTPRTLARPPVAAVFWIVSLIALGLHRARLGHFHRPARERSLPAARTVRSKSRFGWFSRSPPAFAKRRFSAAICSASFSPSPAVPPAAIALSAAIFGAGHIYQGYSRRHSHRILRRDVRHAGALAQVRPPGHARPRLAGHDERNPGQHDPPVSCIVTP